MTKSLGLLIGQAIVVPALLVGGTPASAQVPATANASDDARLEEVIVTAQKRSERLIDVPVSITAVSDETLTKENLVSITDFFSRIPNLQFSGNRTNLIALRGVTTGGSNSPTIALLIDDVQFGATISGGLGNSRFPDFDPSTLERIEVLRGPQGTLYGAASLGGLLKYVTKQPATDDFSARIEAGMSTVSDGKSGWNARGTVNLPLFSERAALLVSGFNREDPAWMDNVRAGFVADDVNIARTYGGRAAFLWKPIDDLSITLSALRQKRDAEFGASVQSLPIDTGAVPNWQPRFGRNKIDTAPQSDVGDQELYIGRVEWDLGAVQLTSISSWNKSSGINVTDVSRVFTFIPIFYGYGPNSTAAVTILDIASTEKRSQELRLGGKVGSVDWRAGLFYTKEEGGVDQTLLLYAPDASFRDTPYDGKGPVEYTERAAFADATWHANDRWDLQVGVRYAENKQSSGGGLTVTTTQVRPVFGPTSMAAVYKSEDNSFTFAVSPSYRFNPDLMAYARVASGYRPGGPNARLPSVPASFDPDTVINYELGIKGYVADRTISFDAALFQINWSDVQLQNTDSTSNFTYRTNGGEGQSRGLELSGEYRPTEGLAFSANATFLDAELAQNLPALSGADVLVGRDGDRLPSSAKFTANFGVEQRFGLWQGAEGYVGGNVSYVGGRMSDFVNSSARAARNAQRFELPSYTQVDLRAGVEIEGGWRFDLYGRNVTDEEGVLTANNRNGTSTSSVLFLQPRTIGFTVSKAF